MSEPLSISSRRAGLSPKLICLLVGLASMAIYLPTLDSGFIAIDDPQYVSDNPYILWPTWEKFTGFFTEWEKPATVAGYYQPLTLASLMLDRLIERGLAGYWPMPPQPFVYHLSNLAWHGANSALVCLLAWSLTRNRLAAVLCGLLFGVHPLNVEAVAWVNQRKALLSTFFALLMLFAHVRYARSRRIEWGVATFIAFLLSLLAKPTGLLLPLVLVLVDVWPLRRLSVRSIVEKLPLFVLSAGMGYVAFRSQHLTTGLSRNVAGDDPWRAILLMCHNLSFYLAKTVIPIRLSPLYRLPSDAEISLGNPSFLLGLVGAICVGVLMLIALRRGWRSVWVCLASYILMAAPALGSVRFMSAIAADRFAYMPMIAGVALLAHGLRRRLTWDRIEKRSGNSPSARLIAVLFALFVVPWTVYAVHQQGVWKSSRTYYGAMVSRDPKGADGLFGMGVCCFEEHDQLIQAGIDPDDPRAQSLLDEADRNFRAALEVNPYFSKASSYIAEVLLLRNRNDEAQVFIDNALKIGGDEEAYFFRGMALSRMGNDEAAIESYRHFLEVRPGSRETLRNMGNSLVRLGRPAEALEYYSRLFRLDPDDVDALHNFGGALVATNKPQAALYPLTRAIQLREIRLNGLTGNPAARELSLMADSQYLLACALVNLGRIADGVQVLQMAIANKPALLESVQKSPTLAGLRESDAWKQALRSLATTAPAAGGSASP